MSTSVWGSELKYRTLWEDGKNFCLPLCEVVSWNNNSSPITSNVNGLPLCEVVSWNAIKRLIQICEKTSTSVWGSELKYPSRPMTCNGICLPLCEVVSWNTPEQHRVRNAWRLPLCEVVSWNTYKQLGIPDGGGLPLCEVVSWNNLWDDWHNIGL